MDKLNKTKIEYVISNLNLAVSKLLIPSINNSTVKESMNMVESAIISLEELVEGLEQ